MHIERPNCIFNGGLQEAMHLAQWQKDKILEHRGKYLTALASIMQERQEVEQGLQVYNVCWNVCMVEWQYFPGACLQKRAEAHLGHRNTGPAPAHYEPVMTASCRAYLKVAVLNHT